MIAFIDTHRDVYGVEPIVRVLPIVARQIGWPVRDSEMSGRSAVEDCLG